jgi:methionyl aminopeptidase
LVDWDWQSVMAIEIKTEREIKLMRQAGKIVADTLSIMKEQARPGVATKELDALAEAYIRKQGAIPSFKDYRGYPASICTSVNEQVVHGIPNGKVLHDGDILSVDVGAIYPGEHGMHGDAAITIPVGDVAPEVKRLLSVGQQALALGIDMARAGHHLSDVSAAVQQCAESHGYSVVREYVGHGIGREMHQDPQIPNFGPPGYGPILRPGMTLALEPMINAGSHQVLSSSDGWTVVTKDGSLSVHFEHTILVTAGDPEILTLP